MKTIITLLITFYGLIAAAQTTLTIMPSGLKRTSADTIFVYPGDRVYFKVKKRGKKVVRISEVKPTVNDTTDLLIIDCQLVGNNSSAATLFNPFKKKLNFHINLQFGQNENSMKVFSSAEPRAVSSTAWLGRVTCLKIFELTLD